MSIQCRDRELCGIDGKGERRWELKILLDTISLPFPFIQLCSAGLKRIRDGNREPCETGLLIVELWSTAKRGEKKDEGVYLGASFLFLLNLNEKEKKRKRLYG